MERQDRKDYVFSIYDSKTDMFGPPMTAISKGQIIRGFSDAANNPNDVVGKHPEDYQVFHLGYFNLDKGIFENLTSPVGLGMAIEYVKKDIKE